MPPAAAPDGIGPQTLLTETRVQTDSPLPTSPSSATAVGLRAPDDRVGPAGLVGSPSGNHGDSLIQAVFPQDHSQHSRRVYLELKDGAVYEGFSFGAERDIAGELVFQTGMVGYPESITDPSYRGQILVITFPLVGNYGVPSREALDEILKDCPRYFESSEIHIAGLVVASYSGEDYSHHLATSSLGRWLQEQNVPAMQGVDTRALTKRIREEGSMLGRMLRQRHGRVNGLANGHLNGASKRDFTIEDWKTQVDPVPWVDPNLKNLVRDG